MSTTKDQFRQMMFNQAVENGDEWFQEVLNNLERAKREVEAYRKSYRRDGVKNQLDNLNWAVHYLAQFNYNPSGAMRATQELAANQPE